MALVEKTHRASWSWEEQLAAYRKDEKYVAERAKLDEVRSGVLPAMRESLRAFIAGETSVEEFRTEFDKRTRTEWKYFGLKGMSGAMFLNTLVKHLPDQELVAQQLKDVLNAPTDEDEARGRLREFQLFLDAQIEQGVVDKTQVQPSRAPFLVSGWWHVQAEEKWPIYYISARSVLKRYAGFKRTGDVAEDYLAFRRLYLDRAAELGLGVWGFEHLCAWLDRAPAKQAEPKSTSPQPTRVWLFAPGAKASDWEEMHSKGIAGIGWEYLGDLREHASLEAVREKIASHRGPNEASPINAGLACYQFAHEMQPGDRIFAKRGKREIVGVGTVGPEYRYEPGESWYQNVRSVEWTKKGTWRIPRDLVLKTLTDIGKYPQLVREIDQAITGEPPDPEPDDVKPYKLANAERELFLADTEISDLLSLVRNRKNLILQGPPGTGKSFLARRLAWLATGERGSDRLASVQFHQSYGYEDFVQGYRPSASGGFERVDGPFLRFCQQALQDQDNDYVLLIDEINRGNLSRIFGELMLLIEPDKRDAEWAVQLAYSTEEDAGFHVPPNLLIIGTMNTADRSLALVDYALRRRFAFFDVEPAFSGVKFEEHLVQLGVETSLQERIRDRMASLNQEIRIDPDLGPGYRVGHSYFCSAYGEGSCDETWYEQVIQTEIAPLLREYWPEDEERAKSAVAALLEEA
jgi:MoxR-like ATPase